MPDPVESLSPEALDLIIQKEAEELTEEDILKMITHFRKERVAFQQAEREGKKITTQAPSAASSSSSKPKKEKTPLSQDQMNDFLNSL